jgi:ElaB/YqjD/DUF883 family membrane-anchored ribosome-binding protein
MSDEDAEASAGEPAAGEDADTADEPADDGAGTTPDDVGGAEETEETDDTGNADGEPTGDAPSADALSERLDAAAEALDAAETESDLDDVAATLDTIESDLDAATFEEDGGDEDDDGPRADFEARLDDSRADLDERRGPYASDAVETVGAASDTVADTRWTASGLDDLVGATETLAGAVGDALDEAIDQPAADAVSADDLGALTGSLDAVTSAIERAGLDPDADAETIASLVEAADAFAEAVDGAEGWDDLSVREQLQAEGFYEPLDHRKDFPPEWNALKLWERRGRADMVLLAHEKLDSEFMEAHCLDALKRMGDPAAFDTAMGLAERRDRDAIEDLGKIGPDAADAVGDLIEYLDADGDPQLQRVTLRALGEIGDPAAVEPVAGRLADDRAATRSRAARALGLLGDPRAIGPLVDTLRDDDADEVRASAAWALRQIGTEDALDAAAAFADDRSYIVQSEAEKATGA